MVRRRAERAERVDRADCADCMVGGGWLVNRLGR